MPTHTAKSKRSVDIGDGVHVPDEIVVTDDDANGFQVTLTAVYQAESGRYECREITVRRADEVTGKALRELPVATILRAGVLAELAELLPIQTTAGLPPGRLSAAAQDRVFRWVARKYRLALLVGDAPTQAVADALDVPRSTAGRWVTRARDRGLLTVQDPRGSVAPLGARNETR